MTKLILLTPKHLPANTICQGCIELLLDYVAAGNEALEKERCLTANHRPAHDELAPVPLDYARARRAEAHKRLFHYQRQIECPPPCPNRSSRICR